MTEDHYSHIDYTWNAEDVDQAARAALRGEIPPLEQVCRTGPNPPHEYFVAVGVRIRELRAEQERGQ